MENTHHTSLSISKDQVKSLYSTFKDLSISYKEKEPSTSDQDWLARQYQAFCPSLTEKEASELGKATVNGVSRFQTTLQDVMTAAASGTSKEQWFADKMAQETQSLSTAECGNYIHTLNQALISGNNQMMNQDAVQISGDILTMSPPEVVSDTPPDGQWNALTLKDAFLNLGQNGALTGLQSMLQGDSFDFSADTLKDVPAIPDSSFESAIESGQTEQIKTLLTAAVKIGVNSGKLPFLPKSTPVDAIATVTSNGVEYISTLSQFSNGKITLMQAMNHVGICGISTLYNLLSGEGLGAISTALVYQIPVIGPVIANVVGALVTAAVGGKIHEKIHQTIKRVENTVRTAANTVWNTIKATGQKIKNTVKNFCSWLFA